MNERLQKVVQKYEKELEEWYENIRHHQEQSILPYNFYSEHVPQKPIDIEAQLHQLLGIFIDYAGKGGLWDWHESLEYGTGFSTGIISKQIDHPYILGVDKHSIYFETPVAYPESIRKMFDRFVQTIADYSRFGVFSYNENEIFGEAILKTYRGLLKKKIKGQLPDLMRHYFIAEAELGGEFDFGFLEIKWPLNQFSIYQILTESCEAFETIHRLNFELWKKSKSRIANRPDSR